MHYFERGVEKKGVCWKGPEDPTLIEKGKIYGHFFASQAGPKLTKESVKRDTLRGSLERESRPREGGGLETPKRTVRRAEIKGKKSSKHTVHEPEDSLKIPGERAKTRHGRVNADTDFCHPTKKTIAGATRANHFGIGRTPELFLVLEKKGGFKLKKKKKAGSRKAQGKRSQRGTVNLVLEKGKEEVRRGIRKTSGKGKVGVLPVFRHRQRSTKVREKGYKERRFRLVSCELLK